MYSFSWDLTYLKLRAYYIHKSQCWTCVVYPLSQLAVGKLRFDRSNVVSWRARVLGQRILNSSRASVQPEPCILLDLVIRKAF